MKTLRAAGRVWNDNGDGYETLIDGRFTATVWPFGNGWQCKVLVDGSGKRGRVGICLAMQPDRTRAMRHALAWIKRYQWRTPQTPEALYATSLRRWPTLYVDRVQVIEHVWYVIGNGYDWLDGAIVDTSPEDYLEASRMERRHRKDDRAIEALLREMKIEPSRLRGPPPKPDAEGRFHFYPAAENYSLVACVPADARPEWIRAAVEAADILRRLSDDESNRALGERVHNELLRRL